ncbi:putative adenine phosphoribosyltransferase 1 [Phaeomoniella chlamydospora]|uniref:adenine phosphoribosyltransferase n=1 Tax=Phaeomoniella chlamydospora TaxID=158046 RepID=A0A0G2E686_PHACM|nr:putative adenine phosphoribosyltransferase 1 [Phaeomoniella chlamydospora]
MSRPYTGAHPPPSAPDATQIAAGQSTPHPSPSAELASLKVRIQSALRQFQDFPSKGILFEDIMPIFQDPELHSALIRSLELHVLQTFGEENKPDLILGLEARGFLFGPSLALRLGAGFVAARKKGKLPGPTVEAAYEKEYGHDYFQMQADAVKEGQKVIIVDDIIATGGTAAAAGDLVKQLGGKVLEYIFLMELEFLHGRDKLEAPVYTLLSGQKESST